MPRKGAAGLRCVFSREEVRQPAVGDACATSPVASTDGSLNCHGYGSSVMVTAAFGLAAAGEVVEQAVRNVTVRAAMSPAEAVSN
jgi:tRNA threonylcarbamoyladenosine dehydratase